MCVSDVGGRKEGILSSYLPCGVPLVVELVPGLPQYPPTRQKYRKVSAGKAIRCLVFLDGSLWKVWGEPRANDSTLESVREDYFLSHLRFS